MQSTKRCIISVILIILIEASFVMPVFSASTSNQTLRTTGIIISPILKVNGQMIEDALGNQVKLKGIQVGWNDRVKTLGTTGMAESPENSWFTTEDISRIKAAGGNVIELHENGLVDLMPSKNSPNEAYFSNWLDKWVAWCTQNKVYAIIGVRGIHAEEDWAIQLSLPNWLWQGMYDKPTTKAQYDAIIRDFFDTSVTKQDSNRQAFIDLWTYIANRYKDNPYVMYGIINEPFNFVDVPADNQVHLSQTYSTLMEKVVDGIRSTGTQQIVFIDDPFLGGNTQPVNKENIVWEVHEYIGPWCPTLNQWKSSIDQVVQKFVIGFGKPLFVGEYGFDPISEVETTYASNWQSLLNSQVSYMDSKQISGRQWHAWDYIEGEYADYTQDSTFDLQESNWIVQTVLG